MIPSSLFLVEKETDYFFVEKKLEREMFKGQEQVVDFFSALVTFGLIREVGIKFLLKRNIVTGGSKWEIVAKSILYAIAKVVQSAAVRKLAIRNNVAT